MGPAIVPRVAVEIHNAVQQWDASKHNTADALPINTVNAKVQFGDTILLVRKDWIDLKKELLFGKNKKKIALLRGKAGRGKSSFVAYFMFSVLLEAKLNKGKPDAELLLENLAEGGHQSKRRRISMEKDDERLKRLRDPVITFVTHGDSDSVIVRLSLDGAVVCPSAPYGSHYYINDYISGGNAKYLGSYLTMGVTSQEKQKERFEKNLAEECGTKHMMLSPSVEELRLMFDDLDGQDLDHRIEVVGNNPRLLEEMGGPEDLIVDDELYDVVEEAARESLGEEHPYYGWAVAKVVSVLRAERKCGSSGSTMTLSSMFLDFIPSNIGLVLKGHCFEEVSSSRFMAFVHGKLIAHFKSSTDETLKALFGSSGIGQCHEYDCHQFLLRMTAGQSHLCWSASTEQWMPVTLGPITDTPHQRRKIVPVRTIEDIKKLGHNDYGLPSICNYPLIDSVLKPSITTQMTISKRHRGAIGKLNQIKRSMELENEQIKMIFFATENSAGAFVFPSTSDLPYTDMYVTVPVFGLSAEKANELRAAVTERST